MSNSEQTNRVFGRLGARELTPEEVTCLSSERKNFFTLATFNPITLHIDGDPRE